MINSFEENMKKAKSDNDITKGSTKETTQFHIFKQEVIQELFKSNCFNSERESQINKVISRCWSHSETILMCIDELELILRKNIIKNESPLRLAKRVVCF